MKKLELLRISFYLIGGETALVNYVGLNDEGEEIKDNIEITKLVKY
jgi:hypothetical protein